MSEPVAVLSVLTIKAPPTAAAGSPQPSAGDPSFQDQLANASSGAPASAPRPPATAPQRSRQADATNGDSSPKQAAADDRVRDSGEPAASVTDSSGAASDPHGANRTTEAPRDADAPTEEEIAAEAAAAASASIAPSPQPIAVDDAAAATPALADEASADAIPVDVSAPQPAAQPNLAPAQQQDAPPAPAGPAPSQAEATASLSAAAIDQPLSEESDPTSAESDIAAGPVAAASAKVGEPQPEKATTEDHPAQAAEESPNAAAASAGAAAVSADGENKPAARDSGEGGDGSDKRGSKARQADPLADAPGPQPPIAALAAAVATSTPPGDSSVDGQARDKTEPIASAGDAASALGDSLTTRRDDSLARSESVEAARPGEQRPAIDPEKFLTRVTRAFEAADQRGGGPIRLRLSPPELGSLHLRLEVQNGGLTAHIETESHAARHALLDNLPALRDRLAEQQIRVERFDVDVREGGVGGGGSQAFQQDPRQGDGGGEAAPRYAARRDAVAAASATPRSQSPIPDGRLNVVA